MINLLASFLITMGTLHYSVPEDGGSNDWYKYNCTETYSYDCINHYPSAVASETIRTYGATADDMYRMFFTDTFTGTYARELIVHVGARKFFRRSEPASYDDPQLCLLFDHEDSVDYPDPLFIECFDLDGMTSEFSGVTSPPWTSASYWTADEVNDLEIFFQCRSTHADVGCEVIETWMSAEEL